jgi:hypothetical protein
LAFVLHAPHPALTRTHIARLMAAIIGRNERHFGFGRINNSAAGKANADNPNRPPRQTVKPHCCLRATTGPLPRPGSLATPDLRRRQGSSLHRLEKEAWLNSFHDLVHRLFNDSENGFG